MEWHEKSGKISKPATQKPMAGTKAQTGSQVLPTILVIVACGRVKLESFLQIVLPTEKPHVLPPAISGVSFIGVLLFFCFWGRGRGNPHDHAATTQDPRQGRPIRRRTPSTLTMAAWFKQSCEELESGRVMM